MRAPYLLPAGIVLLVAACGCQKAATPVRQPPAPVPHAPSGDTGQTDQVDDGTKTADIAGEADQPDDPGMTTDQDKTVKQEQPSGDESSQAAPNEGDAEPPQ